MTGGRETGKFTGQEPVDNVSGPEAGRGKMIDYSPQQQTLDRPDRPFLVRAEPAQFFLQLR